MFCSPYSPHAVTMGHVHVPLSVPRGERSGTQGHLGASDTVWDIKYVGWKENNLGDWVVMLRAGGCASLIGEVVGMCVSRG